MDGRTGAGSLGVRLAGRLTAELILRSPQYMSCVKDYELDLRGNKVSAIENLGATENQFDSIDLTDNAIARLEGFPKLHRLRTLLLSNNRISRIAPNLEEQIPNLEWLVLTNNRINNLQDLDPLWTLTKLKYLSLIDNSVTKKSQYRLYVISRCKRLKVLDFRKITEKERVEAARAFGVGAEAPAPTFDPEEDLAEAEAAVGAAPAVVEVPSKGPTSAQLTSIKAAIANAATLDEVQRLENALKTGNVPSEFQVAGAGDEATAMEQD